MNLVGAMNEMVGKNQFSLHHLGVFDGPIIGIGNQFYFTADPRDWTVDRNRPLFFRGSLIDPNTWEEFELRDEHVGVVGITSFHTAEGQMYALSIDTILKTLTLITKSVTLVAKLDEKWTWTA